jgi:peptide/nickel transport system permease protein/oligopeptide transport system permease protein
MVAHRGGAFGAALVAIVLLAETVGPLVSPYDPYRIDMESSLQAPGLVHPLGTDIFGRDIATRVLYGARFTLQVSVLSRLIAIALGAALGLLAGYAGGRIDGTIMRLADVTLAYPGLLLLIAVMAAVGPSMVALFVALGVVGWAGVARIVRAQVLSLKEREFVTAIQSLGAPGARVIVRHLLPNVVTQLIVVFSMGLGTAIMAESSLSFLGLGAQPPEASWGAMISAGLDYLRVAPWVSIVPGVIITVTILGFNLVGDALRDVLDPKLSGSRRR